MVTMIKYKIMYNDKMIKVYRLYAVLFVRFIRLFADLFLDQIKQMMPQETNDQQDPNKCREMKIKFYSKHYTFIFSCNFKFIKYQAADI